MQNFFDLKNQVVLITGGAGLLGRQHTRAIAAYGATPVVLDLFEDRAKDFAAQIATEYNVPTLGLGLDITQESQIIRVKDEVLKKFGKIDVLINNAANNPQVSADNKVKNSSRLENFDVEMWNQDIAVGLTGAFLCAKHFGFEIAKNPEGGSIINISSDLGVIAPDQRLYSQPGLEESQQNVKPVTYSVIKTGLIGLTRYLATYWAHKKVRCNALCPGGVFNGQGDEFVKRVSQLIPMGRMAHVDEYQGAIIFLASKASAYMNGAVLSIDGGRSCW